MMAGVVRAGTSGWQYDWRGVVDPECRPKQRWLDHDVTLFPTVEVELDLLLISDGHAVDAGARPRVPGTFGLTGTAAYHVEQSDGSRTVQQSLTDATRRASRPGRSA